MILSFGFLLLFVAVSCPAQSQYSSSDSNSVLEWNLDTLYVANSRIGRVYKDLSIVGWRIKKASPDSITLQIKNINGLKRFLKKRKYSVQVEDETITSSEFRDKILAYYDSRNDEKDNRKFRRYLKRVRKNDLYQNTIFSVTLPGPNSNDFDINFLWKDSPFTRLEFSTYQMKLAKSLPELENEVCDPLFRRIWKYDDLDTYLFNIRYRNYRPRSKTSVRKNFELYFKHNSSEYNRKDIDTIIRYMQDSNLVIRKAYIKAYASVEGDLANNLKLQRNRAEILVKTFEKVNEEEIDAEIETAENWEQLYYQLAEQGWTEFLCLDQETVKHLLTKEEIRDIYEPLLEKQRKAVLALRLTKKLTIEEKLEYTLRAFGKVHKKYQDMNYVGANNPKNRIYRNLIKDMLAIKEYARKMVDSGLFEEEVFETFYHNCFKEMQLADFYNFRHQFKREKYVEPQLLQSVILKAYDECYNLPNPAVINTQDKDFRHLMRILLFSFDLIDKKILPMGFIHELTFPSTPAYSFLNASKQSYMIKNGISELSKIPAGTDQWFENKDVRFYYEIIRQLAGVSIKNDVLRIKKRDDWYYQFDLWESLWFNVTYWRPIEGRLYDKEITPERMSVMLDRLININDDVCSDDLYRVALTFHIKMLQLQNHRKAFNKYTSYSYRFIRNYFNSRMEFVDEELLRNVYETLFTFNNYRFYNESVIDADNLIKNYQRYNSLNLDLE